MMPEIFAQSPPANPAPIFGSPMRRPAKRSFTTRMHEAIASQSTTAWPFLLQVNWVYALTTVSGPMLAVEQVPSLRRSPLVVALSASKAAGSWSLICPAMPLPMAQKQLQPCTMTSNEPLFARAMRSPRTVFITRGPYYEGGPMKLRLLALSLGLFSLTACFNFDAAYCDGGYCDDGGTAGGAPDASTGGGAGGGGGEIDAGELDAGDLDAGATDAGQPDAGELDAGLLDAGPRDAGCGGAVQLAFVSPALTVGPDTCSAAVKVQLQDGCGAPVLAAANVPVSVTSSSATMQLFSDSACTTTPFSWSIAAGASDLDLHVMDSAPGMPALQASSAGLDAGSQLVTIGCGAGQRACPTTCVPTAGCCDDTECTAGGLPWVCTTSHVCAPPPCTGFPANCTVFDDRTAAAASRTITFGSTGYSPKCMRVTPSQDVTFSGTFVIHPLQQTCGPSDSQMTTTNGTTRTVRFPNFGTYGYRCANHPAFEVGAIRVP